MPNDNKNRTQSHFTLGRPLPAAAAVGIIVMTKEVHHYDVIMTHIILLCSGLRSYSLLLVEIEQNRF